MDPAGVWQGQQVKAKRKEQGRFQRGLQPSWEPLLLGPVGGYEDEGCVPGGPKFVEHSTDEGKGRKGVEVLVVPSKEEGIRGDGLGILKGGDIQGESKVQTRGEEVYPTPATTDDIRPCGESTLWTEPGVGSSDRLLPRC